ncbi:hypothetical protein BC828DRAFT_110113 [Blastocladiella britannica]|nr:hypothetical protein BC828DRAFT_110113 [Blastocladiella britannica]
MLRQSAHYSSSEVPPPSNNKSAMTPPSPPDSPTEATPSMRHAMLVPPPAPVSGSVTRHLHFEQRADSCAVDMLETTTTTSPIPTSLAPFGGAQQLSSSLSPSSSAGFDNNDNNDLPAPQTRRAPRRKRTAAPSRPAAMLRAEGWARLRFRKLVRWLGMHPNQVAGKLNDVLLAGLSHADVEELKKMFVPLSSLASLLLVLAGPLLFPASYAYICCAFFSLIVFVNYSHVFRFILVLFKLRRTVNDWVANPASKVPYQHLHAIVIPNYSEPLSILRATLGQLATHTHARSHYMVVLAMEAAEGEEAQQKAGALHREYAKYFHTILITVHPTALHGECRGKGSNVAWAAAQTDAHVRANPSIDANRVVLTIIDADAGVAELYFNEVEREMVQSPAHGAVPLVDAQYRVFCPPIFFARNAQAVPALVRATDAAWSIAFMQNLGSPRGLHFPCSSYSVTLPLARHVRGWDTTADAIGEDMHMFLKCFFHTHGLARATPIFCPVNLANVQAHGYWSTITSRFGQARRHFAGSADSLYALRHVAWPEHMDLPPAVPTRAHPAGHNVVVSALPAAADLESGPAVNYNGYLWDRVMLFLHVLEAHMVPATSWITMLALPATSLLNPALSSGPIFGGFLTTMSLIMLVPYATMAVLYEYTHRLLANAELLGDVAVAQKTRRWYNIFDYALLPLCALAYVAAPATSHCANAMRILVLRQHAKEFTYVVAEKGGADEPVQLTSVVAAASSSSSASSSSAPAAASAVPPPAAGAVVATSPALSDVDSALGDFDDLHAGHHGPMPLTPLSMPATPSSIWAAAAKARAAAAMPVVVSKLVLPPAASIAPGTAGLSSSVSPTGSPLVPPAPHPRTAELLHAMTAAGGNIKRPHHSKHNSYDSGFFELEGNRPTTATIPPTSRHLATPSATIAEYVPEAVLEGVETAV